MKERIAAIEEKTPKLPPAVEGVRDGDYRLAPPGPGDTLVSGHYNPDYGEVNGTYLPEPGQKYEVPKVHFGANGLVVEEDLKAPVVEPGFLTVLAKGDERVTRPPARADYVTSGRRRALAEWIASPENPLTPRVIVNRLWYWHFGEGIVPTPGNFGKMGMPPTHPKLLDWLASEFVSQGWSIKHMHRLIMKSETYKMASSYYKSRNLEKDSTNTFLWRYPVRRLEGEAIPRRYFVRQRPAQSEGRRGTLLSSPCGERAGGLPGGQMDTHQGGAGDLAAQHLRLLETWLEVPDV